MSNKPYYCRKCNLQGQCDRVTPVDANREDLFGVVWKCPQCGDGSLIVSPLGPVLAPAAATCLNCGQERLVEGRPCPDCGFSLAEVMTPEEQALRDEGLLQLARDAFALGTCRRGLTLVNYVLRRNPGQGEAWSIKGQFFQYLGFRMALKTAMQEAVRQGRSGS